MIDYDINDVEMTLNRFGINLSQIVMKYLGFPETLHPDTAKLLLNFVTAMSVKLDKAQQKYNYSNDWMQTNFDVYRQELLLHIIKGDPKDVAAYCMFLWYHNQPTITPDIADATIKTLISAAGVAYNNMVDCNELKKQQFVQEIRTLIERLQSCKHTNEG